MRRSSKQHTTKNNNTNNTNTRRFVFVLALVTAPIAAACQGVLEFDRSPLQPEYEASVPDANDGSSDGSSEGGRSEAGSEGGRPDAGPDATPIVDSGADADGG
jgi:hypothetical protein